MTCDSRSAAPASAWNRLLLVSPWSITRAASSRAATGCEASRAFASCSDACSALFAVETSEYPAIRRSSAASSSFA